MRKDKAKNTAKVIKEVIKSPLSTDREIEDNTWVSKSVSNRVRNELGQIGTKDDRILWICDTDLEIVILWQQIIKNRLMDEEELKKISARDVSWIIKENTARYTIFKWDVTDNDWWLREVWDITFNINE